MILNQWVINGSYLDIVLAQLDIIPNLLLVSYLMYPPKYK